LKAAHGRWPEILPRFGIAPKFLKDKHGPCPACGGADRYRFTNRHGDGDYFCNQCGAGKGITLVAKVNRCDYATAAKWVDEYLGSQP
jgi:putative DNA primase/helicase